MKNLKKLITSPAVTIALFILASVLLLVSTIGGIRAAFQAISEIYSGQMQMHCIGVTLQEKCAGDEKPRAVAHRDHLENTADKWDEESLQLLAGADLETKKTDNSLFLGSDTEFKPGKAYTEELSVANTGNIEEYVRVTIYKYWVDPDGNKVFLNETDDEGNEIVKEKDKKGISTQGLSPALIKLNLTNSNVWLLDEKASTEERIVVYYNSVLAPGEDTSKTPLSDKLTIDRMVGDKVTKTVSDDGKTITTKYDYDGWQFCLEAVVDAVQNHNAKDAIKSVWGRDVNVDNKGMITLAD
ncbi:hypothetical protein SAMN04487833_13219 [Sarcina sp. DSM 11001]|uniref:hypothetical protein n=1 Tax=Sarcina sp. DSM 11001 TaxID=1798184 RepID=UPI0008854C67|nr:hypothetical protein [Sarcina sp. DSM 11001]SDL80144.1 hypothetical protein SAMN04487833_13219 [Sarcina sp. DSM 11001]